MENDHFFFSTRLEAPSWWHWCHWVACKIENSQALPRLFERNQRITWGCLKIRKNFGTPIPFPDLQSISLHIFQSIFFFCRCPGWAELFESTEPRTGYIFGCLECGLWCTCHRSSNPGPLDRPKRPKRHWFRKAGFDQRKKKMGASGELLPPILCCKKYHTWENELRLGNQH